MKRCVVLDPAAEEVCNQSSIPPLIFQIPPEEGRQKLEDAQSTPVYKYPANICVRQIDTGEWGTIPIYFVEPQTAETIRNVIFYIHGAGWVFGSFHTHEKLVRDDTRSIPGCLLPAVHRPFLPEHLLCDTT